MKIAFCAPADLRRLARATGNDDGKVVPGLGSTATTPLILELLARGHEITLYTLCWTIQSEVSYTWDKLHIHVGPSRRWRAARTFYAQEIRYLKRKLMEERPEFVNAHWTYEFALASLFAKCPTLVTIHDLPWNVLRFFRNRMRTIRLLMAYMVAFLARDYTAVSDDAATHFRRYLRPSAKIASIPNFVPDIVLRRAKTAKIHPQRPLVFAVVLQGWTRRKNPKAALKAFGEFRKEVPGARLIVMGSDYEKDGPAAKWAAQNQLEDDVTFLGLQQYEPMLDTLAESADALLSPSLDEALSMTVLEGLALGLPVIAGRSTPGIQQELAGGEAGLLVDVRSPRDICSTMLRLQRDPELYRTMSVRGFDRVRSVFCAEPVIKMWEAKYAEMIRVSLCSEGREELEER